MNKLVMVVTLCSFGAVYAQSGKTATPSGGSAAPAGMEMTPPKPGPDQEALKPFVRSASYTGTHMMPDGKEAPTKGKQTCKWLPGGMWAACDIEMSMGTGKTAMKWMGHLVFGYDTMQKGYRGVMSDNMGMQARMKGTLEAPGKLVWESMDEMKNAPPGMPSKERVTDDATNPKEEKMTFEGWMNGKWVPEGSGMFKAK